ncbi:MAG: bactofilin family protein, partial [Pseudomonadales bacterium]
MAFFSKENPSSRSAARGAGETTLSIVSAGTVITGDLSCTGVLKVEGEINGSVLSARQVMLAKGGAIRGDVTAHEIVLGGVVDGNVTAADRLELQPTAVVNGNIGTKSIVVMEGARINGAVKMTELALVGRATDGRELRSA